MYKSDRHTPGAVDPPYDGDRHTAKTGIIHEHRETFFSTWTDANRDTQETHSDRHTRNTDVVTLRLVETMGMQTN